jgi:calcium-binding protein CML
MRKLFNEFDENKNGFISAFELDLMLKKLELPIAAEQVEPLLRKLDRNQSGSIEYDEFKRFVFFDPFPA